MIGVPFYRFLLPNGDEGCAVLVEQRADLIFIERLIVERKLSNIIEFRIEEKIVQPKKQRWNRRV